MKKVSVILTAVLLLLAFCACGKNGGGSGMYIAGIKNPSFETGDLTGWKMKGNIYAPQCVTDENKIDGVNTDHIGRYHLCGRKAALGAMGELRSSDFTIAESGYVSMLLAGGKNREKCYVAVCDSQTNEELTRITNLYFTENTIKEQGMTDRYARINTDLAAFSGRKVYLNIVDRDDGNDYSYLSVDAIDVNVTDENLTVYRIDEKKRKPDQSVTIVDSEYQVMNGGFEKNGFEHWTADGNAFAPETISSDREWVINGLRVPYNNDGNFYNGFGDDANTGTLTSKSFLMGGSGYITFKLGGGRNGALNYVSVYEDVETGTDVEIARFYNQKFLDYGGWTQDQVGNPLHINNMVQYKYDLSGFKGKMLYLKIVDNATANWGMLFCDSFITCYNNEGDVPDCTVAENILPTLIGNEYQVTNGGFETGDLTGWTVVSGNAFNSSVSTEWRFWKEGIPLDRAGNYLVSNIANEGDTGLLRSGTFTVGGSGVMSFRLGGGSNTEYTYISVKRADNDEEVARFGNTEYRNEHFPQPEQGLRIFNMQRYTYDLKGYTGEKLYIEIVDSAGGIADPFNGMVFDDFITYYQTAPNIENSVVAKNLLKQE